MYKIGNRRGFTIVELLIVVVVIAVLAAVVIVGYNGLVVRSHESSMKQELSNAARKLGIYKETNGAYPDDFTASGASTGSAYGRTYSGSTSTYCLALSRGELEFYITQDGGVKSGVCPDTSMQAFNSVKCAALTTFTGANESAIVELTDNRGGTTKTYKVARLADGKCWMLDDLNLGSATSSIELTPADSDVSTNFTLPQMSSWSNFSGDYDTAEYIYVNGEGDSANGAYDGYMYNWPAATAGSTRASKPSGSGYVSGSICPANWRLPIGGAGGEFAVLNAKMNNAGASGASSVGGEGYYQNWLYAGPFRGKYSRGSWPGSSYVPGNYGSVWSGSAHPDNDNWAYAAVTTESWVYVSEYFPRYGGATVRCILGV